MGYHATRDCCRHSIREHGILPNQPAKGRPYGVYVFRNDGAFDHIGWNSRTTWQQHSRLDLWECAYIGPLVADRFVLNAMIFLDTVQHATLVTGN